MTEIGENAKLTNFNVEAGRYYYVQYTGTTYCFLTCMNGHNLPLIYYVRGTPVF